MSAMDELILMNGSVATQPGLFMNRRDDCAEHCPHTGFSDRAEYQCVFPREENSVCGQGSSKGASAFMNSPG